MFDDIILEKKPKEKTTYHKNCGNCYFGSWLASKENGKIWCGKRNMHMHPAFFCLEWRESTSPIK